MRSTLHQHPERSQPDAIIPILTQGYLAHVAYQEAGQPYVIPFAYHFDPAQPEWIWLHASQNSHTLKLLATGVPVCITVSLLDGLVYSRSAKYHSMNYRSVVCFGHGQEVSNEAHKAQLLKDMVARIYPGREEGSDYAPTTPSQLKGTRMVGIRLEASTAKVRNSGPKGPGDDEPFASGNCGVAPLKALNPDWRPQIWQQPPFWVSTEPSTLAPEKILALLTPTYWSEGITLANVLRRLQNSLCFGLYHHHELIGFARLITDYDSFAYLADVVIDPNWRGQGLGTFLLACIQSHPLMAQVRWSLLASRGQQAFYQQQGWQPHDAPERLLTYRHPSQAK